MAGRGRGRGKSSFDLSKLGIQKGDPLPPSVQQPPPLFPPLHFKPVPLSSTEADDYLVALKQEFRGLMQESVYFIKPDAAKKDVERYSDRHRESKSNATWQPDWSRFPEELREKTKKRAKSKPNLNRSKIGHGSREDPDVTKHLDELSKETGGDDDEEEDDNEVEDGGKEREYDEEEQEEDNDYLVSHYEDGEEVGFQDDDDMDEGPTY